MLGLFLKFWSSSGASWKPSWAFQGCFGRPRTLKALKALMCFVSCLRNHPPIPKMYMAGPNPNVFLEHEFYVSLCLFGVLCFIVFCFMLFHVVLHCVLMF
jgi:hypothetical protein